VHSRLTSPKQTRLRNTVYWLPYVRPTSVQTKECQSRVFSDIVYRGCCCTVSVSRRGIALRTNGNRRLGYVRYSVTPACARHCCEREPMQADTSRHRVVGGSHMAGNVSLAVIPKCNLPYSSTKSPDATFFVKTNFRTSSASTRNPNLRRRVDLPLHACTSKYELVHFS
jgi:hypothetical protein